MNRSNPTQSDHAEPEDGDRGGGTWGVLNVDLGDDLDGRQGDLQVGDAGELGEVVLPYEIWSGTPV